MKELEKQIISMEQARRMVIISPKIIIISIGLAGVLIGILPFHFL